MGICLQAMQMLIFALDSLSSMHVVLSIQKMKAAQSNMSEKHVLFSRHNYEF